MRHLTFLLVLSCLFASTNFGCASSTGPRSIVIGGSDYEQAFDHALAIARDARMPATVVDRRSGRIETDSRTAGSLLEPWDRDNASFNQAAENTLNMQRRSIRFEFRPENEPLADVTVDTSDSDSGPAIVPKPGELVDLTDYTGNVAVDVVVTVERQYRPGQRRSTWTRRSTSQMTDTSDEALETPDTFWTIVGRDTAYEKRLLAELESRLR